MVSKKASAWRCLAGVAALGCVLALMYGAFVIGTAQDGVPNVPAQTNSVVLTALSIVVVVTAMVASVARMLVRWGGTLQRDLESIRQELLALSPTQPLRIVATAPVPTSEALAQAYIDGATARATVIPLARRS
jgi:hypothetical protein